MHPNLTPVTSSNIAGYAYDAPKQKLIIAFIKGTHYLYENVLSSTVEGFKQAPSKGGYFGSNIKEKFITTQLDDEGVKIHLNSLSGVAPAAAPKAKRKKRTTLVQLAQRYPFLRASF